MIATKDRPDIQHRRSVDSLERPDADPATLDSAHGHPAETDRVRTDLTIKLPEHAGKRPIEVVSECIFQNVAFASCSQVRTISS